MIIVTLVRAAAICPSWAEFIDWKLLIMVKSKMYKVSTNSEAEDIIVEILSLRIDTFERLAEKRKKGNSSIQ